ncbi:hypothetical protein N658DRAFT_496112 [Parathielavia hyrcaniae]|uniref:Uncharacterized protein n=1 Tax=Parathielavia hyrcaniae TaxID=113614 RepID=A0AAN6T2B2_9PEZI|nr:hypothetical protein N658DRAFT_496112 [Parathielavia hyrcaniae]
MVVNACLADEKRGNGAAPASRKGPGWGGDVACTAGQVFRNKGLDCSSTSLSAVFRNSPRGCLNCPSQT